MKKVNLTEKEAFLLWTVACWFEKPITSTLKYKLFDAVNEKRRKEMDKKYEKEIIKQIADKGTFIAEEHPEWIKET